MIERRSVRDRAAARFAGIRRDAHRRLAADEVAPDPVPDGYCATSIARLTHNAADLLEPVLAIQASLAGLGRIMAYPPGSLHVSLLGLTQRHDTIERSLERDERFVDLVRSVTLDRPPVEVEIGRLNLLGSQWFVEVIPVDGVWAEMRVALGTAAGAVGEDPMVHPDPEPMHLNVARVTGSVDTDRARTMLDDLAIGTRARLSFVEIAITDFVVTPDTMQLLGVAPLGVR